MLSVENDRTKDRLVSLPFPLEKKKNRFEDIIFFFLNLVFPFNFDSVPSIDENLLPIAIVLANFEMTNASAYEFYHRT